MPIMSDRKVKIKHDFYRLFYFETFKDEAEADKALYRVYGVMERVRKKYHVDVSFLIVMSQTDGKTALNLPVRAGKRGRPPRVAVSRKKPVDWHLHIVAYGKKVSSFMQTVAVRINKNKGKCIAKKDKCWDSYFVPYMWEQSRKKLSSGDFDFNLLRDGYYREDCS